MIIRTYALSLGEKGTSWLAEKYHWHCPCSCVDNVTSCPPRWRIWMKPVVGHKKKNLHFCASFLMVVIAWMLFLFHGQQNQIAIFKIPLKFLIWDEAIYSEHIISHCVRALSAVMAALLCCWICKFCVAMCVFCFSLRNAQTRESFKNQPLTGVITSQLLPDAMMPFSSNL